MPEYLYLVADHEGHRRTGEIEAPSPERAVARLHKRGFTVIRIDPVRPKHWIWYLLNPVKPEHLVHFVRQLATMVETGIPLPRALLSLVPEHGSLRFRRAVERLQVDIQIGFSLSQAMRRAPEIFSPFVVGSTRIGEVSGHLGETLKSCAEHLEKEFHYGLRLRQALIYPAVLMACCGALVAFIFTFMIPRFVSLFVDLQVELPWATQLLMDVTNLVKEYWLRVVCTLAGPVTVGVWIFRRWAATPQGKWTLEWMLLRLPLYGKQVRRRMLARYFRSFATLIRSGVMVSSSLHLMARSLDQEVLSVAARAQMASVRRGHAIVKGMKAVGFFPPMAIEMVRVGEETGKLPEMMYRLAGHFDEEMVRGLSTLSKLIEPVVLLVLGGAVGFVLLAAFLPIYQLAASF